MIDWIQRHPLAYVAMTVAVLLAGWEVLAQKFTLPPPNRLPLESVSVALYEPGTPALPSPNRQPRLMILGNSQVHYVRDHDDIDTYGFPARLEVSLREQGQPAEIADLSAGGQQAVESLAILIDTFDRVRPDHVVLGLGLANLRGTTIPPHLIAACDWDRIRTTTSDLLDQRIPGEISRSLLQLFDPPREVVVSHDPTIQEQIDERIALWLTEQTATVRHRSVMSQWASKLPGDVEREIRTTWRKQVRKQLKARTYDAGPNYEVSFAAVQLMAAYCRKQQVPFTVMTMPFHPSCTPVVYVPQDEQRLISELQQLVDVGAIQWQDFSRLLGSEHYGSFPDGSPDGLHYLASGHTLLGQAVAERLGEQLTNPAIAHREETLQRQ